MANATKVHSGSRTRKRFRVLLIPALMLGMWFAIGAPASVFAHAEPERANPPISGVVTAAPAVVEIWFSEEVAPDESTIQVIGPGGVQVDLGDAKVDLFDPDRKHMTVSLRSGLGPGVYTVQWHTVSSADGDEAQGGYVFAVDSASPVASPIASPAPDATTEPVSGDHAVASPEGTGAPAATPASEGYEFDSAGFGLSVGAGLVAAAMIFVFWRMVRPKNRGLRG